MNCKIVFYAMNFLLYAYFLMWTHFRWISIQNAYELFIPILEASSALHDVISILTPVRIIPSFSLFLRVQVWIIFFYIFLFSLIVSSSEYHVQCNLYRILIVIMCCLLICLQKEKLLHKSFNNFFPSSFPFFSICK